jgi:transposase
MTLRARRARRWSYSSCRTSAAASIWILEPKLQLDQWYARRRRGNLVKVLWHDTLGMSLYAKRLERGKFIWPSPADGVVVITPAQLAYMLESIDWRHPQRTWRPEAAG